VGPIVLFLHGVPTNRRQWYPVAKMVARHCRVVCIDMLGMGESSKPRLYGLIDKDGKRIRNEFSAWDWKYDPDYIHKIMVALYGNGVKYVFVADDWGGGILVHHCEQYNDEVIAQILVDPIALDGYPVREIMAIGRTAGVQFMKGMDEQKKEETFQTLMAAFDQTLTQIYKTMVHNPNKVYDQYTLRDIQFPYMDVDYHKNNANSLNMGLKWWAIHVLADRASRLGSPQLFPRTSKNPNGVNYFAMTMPTCIVWGLNDNMMPAMQRFRLQQLMRNALVDTKPIQEAGHFVSTDQPHLVAEAITSFIIGRFGVSVISLSVIFFYRPVKRY